MKVNNWFKHSNCASFDERMTRLIAKEQSKGYGTYWYIIEMMCLQPHSRVSFEYLRNIKRPGFSLQYMKKIITQYGLFKVEDDYFSSLIPYGTLQESTSRSTKQRSESETLAINEQKKDEIFEGKAVQSSPETQQYSDEFLPETEPELRNFSPESEQVSAINPSDSGAFSQPLELPQNGHNTLNSNKLPNKEESESYARTYAGRTEQIRRDKNKIKTITEKKERKDAAVDNEPSLTNKGNSSPGYLILMQNHKKHYSPFPPPPCSQWKYGGYTPQPYAQRYDMLYQQSGCQATTTYGEAYGMYCQNKDSKNGKDKGSGGKPFSNHKEMQNLKANTKNGKVRPWRELVDELQEDSIWVENACMKSGYGLLLKRYFKEAVEEFRKHIELYDKGDELTCDKDVKQYFANFTAAGQRTSKALRAYLITLDTRRRADQKDGLFRFEQCIDGRRTYGGQPIPNDAPPRPNASSIWNEETRQWVMLCQYAQG